LTEDESKEVYAHYGLTIYCSSVLEHGAANALCILELLPGRVGAKTRSEWETKVDSHYADSFAETLGRLIKRLKSHSSVLGELGTLAPDLEQCVVRRNFLVHHFWRERATYWFTDRKRRAMIQELETDRELFWNTDKKLEAAMEPIAAKHGVTPEHMQATEDAMMREAMSDD
jgi:hypothetical protein